MLQLILDTTCHSSQGNVSGDGSTFSSRVEFVHVDVFGDGSGLSLTLSSPKFSHSSRSISPLFFSKTIVDERGRK
jgi:hypothetical protein